MKRLIAAAAVTLLCFAASPRLVAAAGVIAPGAGRFDFYFQGNAGRPMNVWSYRPKDLTPAGPVLFVMAGTRRDAQRYRDEWQSYAERFKTLLLAPEFSAELFPGRRAYNLGNLAPKGGASGLSKDSAFAVIEQIFDYARQLAGVTIESYRIYGHSAGAQFVHRLVLLIPRVRVDFAVAANAGWYTMADFTVAFPYGLKGAGITPEDLKPALGKKLLIALGENDNDPNDLVLNRSAGAMRQGAARLERGGNFFRQAEHAAARLEAPFNWQIMTVPGAGHRNSAMAQAVAPLLLK
jgi:hypothetical protein